MPSAIHGEPSAALPRIQEFSDAVYRAHCLIENRFWRTSGGEEVDTRRRITLLVTCSGHSATFVLLQLASDSEVSL